MTREIGQEKARRTKITQNAGRPKSPAIKRWTGLSLVAEGDAVSPSLVCGTFGEPGEAMDTAAV